MVKHLNADKRHSMWYSCITKKTGCYLAVCLLYVIF